ncbi:MAG: N-acetylmannosamine-6-phosphate 2-epimerase, partial [Fusobacterium sp.]|nr:N-acetylmannosamine-6-phosphate 2-epimerase [Fusobacterium sp.]MCI5725830.1 N-acetylmannosamine-6-phosphate 2-epimerase [Fusobacterium sp.]
LDLGAFAVVVGGAITRPQQITKKFVDEMSK